MAPSESPQAFSYLTQCRSQEIRDGGADSSGGGATVLEGVRGVSSIKTLSNPSIPLIRELSYHLPATTAKHNS